MLLGGLDDHPFEIGEANAFAALAAIVRNFSVFVGAMPMGGMMMRVIVVALAALELVLQACHLDSGHCCFESFIA